MIGHTFHDNVTRKELETRAKVHKFTRILMKLEWLNDLIKYAGGQRMLIPYRTVALWMSKLPKIPTYLARLGLMRNLDLFPDTSDHDKSLLGKLDYRPFKKVPDIESFEIEISNYDVLYAACGIRKRWSPKLSFTPGKNRAINRYILNQKMRLSRMAEDGNSDAFFRISDFLVKRSKCFFISQLSHSYKNWHREKSWRWVKKLYGNVRFLARENHFKLDYKRVFIPKSEAKLRPLGVPSPEWIMYLGLWNRFMMLYVMTKNLIQDGQHAYLPGKGTKTAWEQIFNDVRHHKYIYSFDLESFFPSIDHNYLYRKLKEKGFPDWVNKWVYDLNANLPKGLYFTKSEWTEIEQVSEPMDKTELARQSISKKLPEEIAREPSEEDPYGELRYREVGDGSLQAARGVPQGGPISPLLSLLCLEELFNKDGIKTLMYADDGLFYTNDPRKIYEIDDWVKDRSFLECGTRFAPSKSYWVKKRKWLEPLKFLGLTYYGKQKLLYASTRKGSSLVFDKLELLDLLRYRDIDSKGVSSEGRPSEPSFEAMIKLGVWGLIQSRLYAGRWNMDFDQKFDYTFIKGSWAHRTYSKAWAKKLNVFNSTSFAAKALLYALKHVKPKEPMIETKPIMEAEVVGDLMKEILSKSEEAHWGTEEGEIPPVPEQEEEPKSEGGDQPDTGDYEFDLEEEIKDYDEGMEKLLNMTRQYGFPWDDVKNQLKMRRMMFQAHCMSFTDMEKLAVRLKPIDERHDKMIKEFEESISNVEQSEKRPEDEE